MNPDQAFYQGAVPGCCTISIPTRFSSIPASSSSSSRWKPPPAKGFGSVVSVLPGRVVVLQTLAETPSEKAGMTPGDEILAVNNYRLDRLDPDQIVELLNESKQKPAQLVVRRPGNTRLLELTLTPEEMKSSSVERAFLLQPGIGYMRVTSFEEKTGQQIHEAIEKLGGRETERAGARSAQ